MKKQIVLLPLSLVAIEAQATMYMTPEQAQSVMFPGETLRPSFRTLDASQIQEIRKASGVSPLSRQLKAWRASGGGWLIIDEVIGKHEFITFAVALTSAGTLKSMEILDYRESYGGQVRDPRWRAQFVGKRAGSPLRVGADIKNISGATLSSTHVTEGVRRLLATYAVVLASG
jgi:Na+-translocating ferredoxin:NAD+ oxidoreductase RnfG subunit